MRPVGLLHGARPRRLPASRPPQRSPGFSTLAPPRPSLVRPRPLISPAVLLVHIGSISFASCLIPVIGARAASTRAAAAVEVDERAPIPLAQPLQRPNPPNLQLFRLAAQLRRQISLSPQDAAFTLRQLHLVTQEPQLFLPAPASTTRPIINPETWVWRLPAAAALHAILRLLTPPSPSPAADALLPIAVSIAEHSLRFDTMMWSAVLRSRDEAAAAEWDERVQRDGGVAMSGGQPKLGMPRVTLAKRPRERASEPNVESWQRTDAAPFLEEDAISDGAPAATSVPSTLRPPASLPARSLDRLFLHLARDRAQGPAALRLTLALSRLRRLRTPDALSRSVDLAIQHKQLDVAAQFCADWLRQLGDAGSSPTMLVRLLRRLSRQLRDGQGSFAAVPSIPGLAAIVHLARALDYLWARVPSPGDAGGDRSGVLGVLVHLLVKVPLAPSPLLFKRGSPRRRHARAHVAAARMAREVLRRVLEDVVGREIVLTGSASTLEATLGAPVPRREVPPLGLFDLNALLAYALHRLQAPEIALAMLERMNELGLAPSPATENILFGAFAGEEEASVERALLRAKEGSERAVPTLLTHLTSSGSFDQLERLVFRLLPELDLAAPTEDEGTDATTRQLHAHHLSSTVAAARAPPASGRNPYLYTTLLHALACAGRVGLAERVFRNARWAAELSRSEDRPGKGWVLPPHAFTSMLRLYAAEVRRGHALERRAQGAGAEGGGGGGGGGAFVRGWGRHALRVFLLREKRALLAAQLGPATAAAAPASARFTAHARGTREGGAFRALPPFLRSEAAPLVAIYELEGGSRAPELESLKVAMRAPQSREALRVLFPKGGMRDGDEGRRLSELGQRAWRRGERARWRGWSVRGARDNE